MLRAVRVAGADGALLPDGLDHLLHDAGAQLRAVPPRDLLAALAGLIPGMTVAGGTAHLVRGPLTVDADLGARTIDISAEGDEGLFRWDAGLSIGADGQTAFHAGLGDVTRDAFAITLSSGPAPLAAMLVRPGSEPVSLWPHPDVDGLTRFATAAIPAEAVRILIEALRPLEEQVGAVLNDLASSLGMLAPADRDGHRAVIAPVRLFEDPVGWLGSAGVLSVLTGAPFDAGKVIDLLEALKPFVGLVGTPRGVWPIADGLSVSAGSSSAGPTVSLSVDATSLARRGRSPAPGRRSRPG